jgi:hypothetical protein
VVVGVGVAAVAAVTGGGNQISEKRPEAQPRAWRALAAIQTYEDGRTWAVREPKPVLALDAGLLVVDLIE